MKQYYLQEFNLNKININKLPEKSTKYSQKIILTNYGYFLCKDDKLLKKKIVLENYFSIDNYIKNYTLLCNDINHTVFKFSNHIDNQNCVIHKEIYEFKIDKFSKTKSVIEVIDNNVTDFYFISAYNPEDMFLKEDIETLVHLLKC